MTLTRGGVRQLQRMDGVLDQVQDDLLQPLSADEQQTLTRLLSRVLAQHERD